MLPEGIDPAEVTAAEDRQLAAVVVGVAQARATVAAAQAAETTMLAAAQLILEQRIARTLSRSGAEAEMPLRSFAAELASVLRISDRSVQTQMAQAADVALRFPAALTALLDGRISRLHLDAIVSAGAHITDADARAGYEASILEYAVTTTAARTKPVAKLRAEKYAPRTVSERHTAAVAERGVWVRELPHGLAQLVAVLPAVLAYGVMDRLGQMAVQVKDSRPDDASDDRKMDAVRADILADLLLTGTPTGHDGGPTGLGAIRAHVQVTVPVAALEPDPAPDAPPAILPGYGPIGTPTVRALAGAATGWDRVTHDTHGRVLTVDRYRPSEAQRRHLAARDLHCRFPGCRQPLHRCDIDHTIDAQHGGPTTTTNLAHLCRRHHSLKHATTWTVRQHPDGTLHWTSPTGRTHPDTPTSTIMFTTEDPPPF